MGRHPNSLDDPVQSKTQRGWAGLSDFVLDDRTVLIIPPTVMVMTPSQLQLDCLLHPYLGRIPGQDGSWLQPLKALECCDGRVVFESPPRCACLDVVWSLCGP